MTGQKHIIKRQVFELHIPESMNYREVQDRASSLHDQKLASLLDKVLSRAADDDSAVKIEMLELDLGKIRIGQFEEMVLQRVEAALEQKLAFFSVPETSASKTSKNETGRISGSDLDLLRYFFLTGLLPWWAPENSLSYTEEVFSRVLTQKPTATQKFFQTLFREDAALKRFVYTFSAVLRDRLLELFLPGAAAGGKALEAKIRSAIQLSPSAQKWKQDFWYGLLQSIIAENGGQENYRLRTTLKLMYQIAGRNPATGGSSALEKACQEQMDLLSVIFSMTSASSSHQQAQTLIQEIKAGMAKLLFIGKSATQNEWKAAEEYRKKTEALAIHWNEILRKQTNSVQRDFDPVASLLADIDSLFSGQAAKKFVRKTDEPDDHSTQGQTNAFDKTDKVFIENAGLVLLWPFLGRFFINTGVADEQTFFDRQSREKACVLLQYLVEAGSDAAFEAHLPLNKVLCGLPLREPLDAGMTISPDEEEACEHFLQAVIQHGPLWKDLSTAAFRQAYLRREGALSTRDGNWLLQVKRETYDVIVDRLPWSVQVVKLPWMKNLLFVEWQQT